MQLKYQRQIGGKFPQTTGLTIGLCSGQDRAFTTSPLIANSGLTDVHRKSTRKSLRPRAIERCDLRPSIQKESAVAISAVADAVISTAAVGLLTRGGRQDGAPGWGTEGTGMQNSECRVQNVERKLHNLEFCILHSAL